MSTPKDSATCKHPPTRLYSWVAYDGTLCVACCECGTVLKGAITDEEHQRIMKGQ